MKTLIVVIHPDFNTSVINKKWVESLQKYPDKFYIHLLHQVYPNENIDIKAEQKLVGNMKKLFSNFLFIGLIVPLCLKNGWIMF